MKLVPPQAIVSVLILSLSTGLIAQLSPPRIPRRVAEEAEVLEQNAARILTQETLEQRSLMPPTRFRPRDGTDAERAAGPQFRIREVVSEFGFGALRRSQSPDLIEFRQVLSVDGQPQQSSENALHALSQGIQQGDDRTRKRMLEQFARNGLVDIATDYALILLAFTSHGQKQIEFAPSLHGYIGNDHAISFQWRQKSAEGGATEFHGQQSAHRALQGTLWVRESDGLPLRIHAWMEYTDQAKRLIRDEATVDYIMSEHGFLTPTSVIHHHFVNASVITENLATDTKRSSCAIQHQFHHHLRLARCRPRSHKNTNQKMTRIVYLHGFASGPQSSKARYFRTLLADAGASVAIPDLADGDFEHLTITGQLSVIDRSVAGEPVALIGSSMGGYLAALYAARQFQNVQRVVLLAPCFPDSRSAGPERLGPAQVAAWSRYRHNRRLPLRR